jgi:hypothetical protein
MVGLQKSRVLFTSIPFLLSGLALVMAIFLHFSIYLFLALQFITLSLLLFQVYQNKSGSARKLFLKMIRVGLLAGVVATAGYDVVRWLVVTIFHFSVRPFDTFRFFGQIILDKPVSEQAAYAVGYLYHLLNGITFSIAFFILFKGKHWMYGVLWAYVLEILMLIVYPRFLNISSVMEEFTIVSCIGHTTYGTIIGLFNYSTFKKHKAYSYGNGGQQVNPAKDE